MTTGMSFSPNCGDLTPPLDGPPLRRSGSPSEATLTPRAPEAPPLGTTAGSSEHGAGEHTRAASEESRPECGLKPRDDENPLDEWRAYSDGTGDLVVFCPECAEREFGAVSLTSSSGARGGHARFRVPARSR
jgi:hypothetical protein